MQYFWHTAMFITALQLKADMNKRTENILKAAIKFATIISQGQISMQQNDIGTAESAALQKSPVWSKVKQLLGPNAVNGAVKFQLTVSVGPTKNAVGVDYNATEIYYANGDFDQMSKIGQTITDQLGTTIAQIMLAAYRSNPGCKKILQAEAQPNSKYVAVIKVSI